MSRLKPAALVEEIAAARWYGGKGEPIAGIREEDSVELADGCSLHVLMVESNGGKVDRYLYVVGEDRIGSPLLDALAQGRRLPGRCAEFVFEAGAALAGSMPKSRDQRPMGIDQSNTSLIVGERLVLKLYRKLEAGEHPEIRLGRYLTDTAHIAFMPAFVGAAHWGDHAILMVQAHVSHATDGWTWSADCVVRNEIEPFALLGSRTAALHMALAQLESRIATERELTEWRADADAQLDRVLTLVDGEARDELRVWEERLRAEYAALETVAPPLLHPLHGDYHIGQILRFADGLRVVDFEGEPTKPLAQRRALGTPLRDVAAMLRSFDHVARYVDRDVDPGNPARIERWIREVRAAFLGAYGDHDTVLLRALEVEKETYEYIYVSTFLPEWMYAPRGGMRWLMDRRR